jgi:hypothetical protein
MDIFNPATLGSAKDVGIPISVLVGILAVFGGIFGLRDVKDRKIFFGIIGCGVAVIASLLFIFWISTKEVYQWVDTKALADWAGNDEGWTDSREPSQMYCNRSREGNVATCWSNRPEGYPSNVMFHGTTGIGAWCTYKLKEKIAVGRADGQQLGRVYICARVSI